MTDALKKELIAYQRAEITEYCIYKRLAGTMCDDARVEMLNRIADDELRQYALWFGVTHTPVRPQLWVVWLSCFAGRLFGIAFGVGLVLRTGRRPRLSQSVLTRAVPEAATFLAGEKRRKRELISLLKSDQPKSTRAARLGLNDVLVEITGTIAGLTLALKDTRMIALAGSIIGVAATLSVVTSRYLRADSGVDDYSTIKNSAYAGIGYFVAVLVLIIPYLVLQNFILCMIVAVTNAMFIVFAVAYYGSQRRVEVFSEKMGDMAFVSLAIVTITVGISFAARQALYVQ